jgi:hypothetical protein
MRSPIFRSLVLRGAATDECKSPTIMVERPLYEEKNASLPVSTNLSIIYKPIFYRLFLSSNSTGCVDKLDQCCLPIEIMPAENGL